MWSSCAIRSCSSEFKNHNDEQKHKLACQLRFQDLKPSRTRLYCSECMQHKSVSPGFEVPLNRTIGRLMGRDGQMQWARRATEKSRVSCQKGPICDFFFQIYSHRVKPFSTNIALPWGPVIQTKHPSSMQTSTHTRTHHYLHTLRTWDKFIFSHILSKNTWLDVIYKSQ